MKSSTKWLLGGVVGVLCGYALYRYLTRKPLETIIGGVAIPDEQTKVSRPPETLLGDPLSYTGIAQRTAVAIVSTLKMQAAMTKPRLLSAIKSDTLQNLEWLKQAAANIMPGGVYFCDWVKLAGSDEPAILRDKMVFINANLAEAKKAAVGIRSLSPERAAYNSVIKAQAEAQAIFDVAIQQALACKAKWELAHPGLSASQMEQEEGIILKCSISDGILGGLLTGGHGTAEIKIGGGGGVKIVGYEYKAPFTGAAPVSGGSLAKK